MTSDAGGGITSGYILDRVTVRPGRLGEYRERVAREYLPQARERGMTLVGSWIEPPLELQDESNDLYCCGRSPSSGRCAGSRASRARRRGGRTARS